MTTLAPRLLHESSEEFKTAVAKSKGRIVLLVHPKYIPGSNEYEKVLAKLSTKSKIPIVVLQGIDAVPLEGFMQPANPFFVITHQDHPKPLKGWEVLHESLREANVKTVLLGGMKAKIIHGAIGGNYYLSTYEKQAMPRPPKQTIEIGCVGTTYKELVTNSPHLKIRLMPGLLYPERPH